MEDRWGLFIYETVNGISIHQWLRGFDPDGDGGYGTVAFTADPAEAMAFPSMAAAMDCWKTPSTLIPLRDDGKPNRPLTAFTVSPMRLDQTPLL